MKGIIEPIIRPMTSKTVSLARSQNFSTNNASMPVLSIWAAPKATTAQLCYSKIKLLKDTNLLSFGIFHKINICEFCSL